MSAFPATLIGMNLRDIFSVETPCRAVTETLQTGETHVFEQRLLWEGKQHCYECRFVRNREDQVLAIIRDVTVRKQTEEKIIRLASRDPLTGLPNRQIFGALLEKALDSAKRYDRLMAVMFLDLDRFKRINDSLGHSVGDMLLKFVSERISAVLRKSDTSARYSKYPSNIVSRHGGDEFTILLSEVKHASDPFSVAQRILDSLSGPVTIGEHEIFITTSIGIAVYPSHGKDMDTLLKNADTALYKAKDAGRNNFQVYLDSMGSNLLIGNRSGPLHTRLDEGRMWRAREGGRHDLSKEMKRVSILEPASPGDGKGAFREPFPRWRLAAETDFSPLHGKAQCALRSVVGRLNAFMEDEGKEVIPVLERPAGAGGDSSVAAGLIVSA